MARQFHQLGCFWSKVSPRTEAPVPRHHIICPGMLHWVILCSGMHTCSHQIYQPQVCRKTNLQKGKINKNREKIHILYLKGRSKHWDVFLTQRYMLAHIPLTKINILASVLTFTSSFSSHLNHYNTAFPCSLPCAYPSKCLHQLPLLQPLSAAFYLFQALIWTLPMAAALISIFLSTPAH